MKIREVKQNKKDYLALLLLADEQESMIDRYNWQQLQRRCLILREEIL